MADPILSLPPDALVQILHMRAKITGNKRFIASWLAIVWFDTLSTLPDERLLWNSRWTFLKVVFLLNRWLSPALQTVWASLVFATITPSETAIMAAAAWHFHAVLLPPGFGSLVDLTGCVASGRDGHANAFVAVLWVLALHSIPMREFYDVTDEMTNASWAAPLTFDTIVMGLTLYNVLVVNRRARHLKVLSHILKDGMLFYVVISLANLVNVVLYAQKDIIVQNFNNPTSFALTTIMSNHLVMNLRKLDRRQRSTPTPASISHLVAWPPPLPSVHSFGHPSRDSTLPLPLDDKLEDEEQAIKDEMELSPLGPSLPSPGSRPETGRRRRPNTGESALVGLERLGLIAPSTAIDISRPMALTSTTRPPFSDVIPIRAPQVSSSTSSSRKLSRHREGTGGSGTIVSSPVADSERTGFSIMVEQETVVSDPNPIYR
ncbi:DUF6533 domain-containing protein [Sporobolomyces koalae]|uniref:DUF6533 domain-containing protein n=1 Tax=Sporobolomyces koalae TaxID=500713 RepID=UPI00317A61D4